MGRRVTVPAALISLLPGVRGSPQGLLAVVMVILLLHILTYRRDCGVQTWFVGLSRTVTLDQEKVSGSSHHQNT